MQIAKKNLDDSEKLPYYIKSNLKKKYKFDSSNNKIKSNRSGVKRPSKSPNLTNRRNNISRTPNKTKKYDNNSEQFLKIRNKYISPNINRLKKRPKSQIDISKKKNNSESIFNNLKRTNI